MVQVTSGQPGFKLCVACLANWQKAGSDVAPPRIISSSKEEIRPWYVATCLFDPERCRNTFNSSHEMR